MSAAIVVVSLLLGGMMTFSAVRKLSHREEVVRIYTRVGVPEDRLDYLAAILLIGTVGLVVGVFWIPIGIAAALGVFCYFLLAIAAHIRAGDVGNLMTPILMELMAGALLVLRVLSV